MTTETGPHLWLIGMMGAGKTTVGARLAELDGSPFIDTDTVIEDRAGATIADLWEEGGEQAFRDLESAAVGSVADSTAASVIATGGGVVLADANVAEMRRTGLIVWLSAPPEVLAARIGDDRGRPLIDGRPPDDLVADLSALLEIRNGRYEAAADEIIDTGATTIGEVVVRVSGLWQRRAGTWHST